MVIYRRGRGGRDAGKYQQRAAMRRPIEPLEGRILFSQPPLTTQPPTAYLDLCPDITSAGGANIDINVEFSSSEPFDPNSFGPNGQIAVTGPGNAALTCTGMTINSFGSGDLVNADYIFAAPGGAWSESDDGTYTVSTANTNSGNSISCIDGTPLPGITLGTFRCFIGEDDPGFPDTITGNYSAQAIAPLAYNSYVAVGSQPDGSGIAGQTQLVVAKYDNGTPIDGINGGDGRMALEFGSSSAGYGVTVQNNGDFVIAGAADEPGSGDSSFAVFRTGPDALPDPNFGQDLNGDGIPDGVETVDVGGTDSVAYADALQGDGGIIAVGTTSTSGGGNFVITRLDPDTGQLDTGFGANGYTTTSFGADSAAGAVLIESDNDILVAGNSGSSVVLACYQPSGQLDPTFGINGTMTVPGLSANNWNVGLALQPDGKILVAAGDQTRSQFAVTRLNSDGSVDSTFGNAGTATFAVGGQGIASSIVVQPGGQIDVGGTVSLGGSDYSNVATLSSSGQLQDNFAGSYYTTFSSASNDNSTLTARSAMCAYPGGIVFAQSVGAGANQIDGGTTQLNSLITGGLAPAASLTSTTVTVATATASFTITYTDSVGIDPATVGTGNITVSDGSENLQVTGATPASQTPGSPLAVTYTVTAPNGMFSSTDNGAYTVALTAQVKNTAGTTIAADGNLGTITIAEAGAPAPVPTLTAAALTTNSAATYSFSVAYSDALGINVGTVGTGNVTVTGPNGALAVTSAVVDNDTNGSPRTVTYTVAAPNGSFSTADNGAYTIGVSDTLKDVNGNPTVANSNLGTFTINVTNPPRTALGSFGTVAGSKKAQKLTVSVNGVPTTFAITNGSGQAYLNGTNVDLTVTAATGKKAAVTVKPSGGRITLGAVAITGNVSTFTAPAADLAGTFYIAGSAGTVSVGNLTNATFDAEYSLTSFKAISLTSSNLLAGVQAGADGVLGTSDDVYGGGVINTVSIAGSINSSVVAAGANPINGVFGDGDDMLAGSGSMIKTITAKGGTSGTTVFESGSIKSASLPKKIKTLSTDSRFKILT